MSLTLLIVFFFLSLPLIPLTALPFPVFLMMKHLPGTDTHFKCYHCFNKASVWHQHSLSSSSFFFPFKLSFFKLHLKEQCHVLSDHLTQSSESLSLLSDHLCLPLFLSVWFFFFFFFFFGNQTHTTMPQGLGLYKKKT